MEYTVDPTREIYTSATCPAGCEFPRRNKYGKREGAVLHQQASVRSLGSHRTVLTTYSAGAHSVLAPTIATKDTIFSPAMVMQRRNSACTTGYGEADRVWPGMTHRCPEHDNDIHIQDLPHQGYRLDSAPWISLNETLAAEARAGTVRDRVLNPGVSRLRQSNAPIIEEIPDAPPSPPRAPRPEPVRQVESVTQPPKPSERKADRRDGRRNKRRDDSPDSPYPSPDPACEGKFPTKRARGTMDDPIYTKTRKTGRVFGKRAGLRHALMVYWSRMRRKLHRGK